MTFNQWAAVNCKFPNSTRLAFEAVWEALERCGCSQGEASSLLTDLAESIPEPEYGSFEDEDC